MGLGKAGLRKLRGASRAALSVATAASFLVAVLPVEAGVRSSTTIRAYVVGGSTPASVVSYMRSRPFQGDYGAAVANIRPSYGLSVATAQSGGACRASSVTLNLNFVITLPRAANLSSMSSGTRSAWNVFASYAKLHEDTHRRIYTQCGNEFVAKAQRVTAPNCGGVQAKVRALLEAEKRICEGRNRAYDRAERGRLTRMSLFKMAGSRGRR